MSPSPVADDISASSPPPNEEDEDAKLVSDDEKPDKSSDVIVDSCDEDLSESDPRDQNGIISAEGVVDTAAGMLVVYCGVGLVLWRWHLLYIKRLWREKMCISHSTPDDDSRVVTLALPLISASKP